LRARKGEFERKKGFEKLEESDRIELKSKLLSSIHSYIGVPKDSPNERLAPDRASGPPVPAAPHLLHARSELHDSISFTVETGMAYNGELVT
jgi:hypothetical protein